MELLIIKSGTDYIRVNPGKYEAVGLDKASVFPMHKLAQVKDHRTRLRASGFPEAAIYRLALEETPL
jgi:hypothetical protein